jgi:hypothetical protein
VIKRVTLKDSLEFKNGGIGAAISSLFKPTFLQEPTFKELIILYKLAGGTKPFISNDIDT